MSEGARFPLRMALPLAEGVRERLAPFCERLEIAGSVRRRCQDVGDIEFVAIPRHGTVVPQGEIFQREADLLHEAVLEIQVAAGVPVAERAKPGAKKLRFLLPLIGLPVEIYTATPETWGVVFMIRTGAGDFSRGMLARWKWVSRDGECRECRLHYGNGTIVGTPTEEDVFRVIGVPWIPPEERTCAAAIQRSCLKNEVQG